MTKSSRNRISEPLILSILIAIAVGIAVYYGQDFALDASSDTLLDQNDPQLRYYQSSRERYGGDEEFLILTYSPNNDDLFSPATLQKVGSLQQQLAALNGVAGVYTILDAPLLKSPPTTIAELANGFRTLNSPDVNLELARQELTTSPIFSDLLVSKDAQTTALRITMFNDKKLLGLRKSRDAIELAVQRGSATEDDLNKARNLYREEKENYLERRAQLLLDVGKVQQQFSADASLYLGGVPSIANDIIDYVRQDLLVFSSTILALVMIMLFWFFRKVRFVVIPVVASAVSILLTIGVLGFLHQKATIVSSNFISILVITTISFCIHLIVKYRELRVEQPNLEQRTLVLDTMHGKFAPCVYTALSTIAAFGSLLTSGILPVRDFGWIICIGIIISFLSAYSLFACIMLFLPKGKGSSTLKNRPILTKAFCQIATQHSKKILACTFIIITPVVLGVTKLSLDNSFIDYFKENTSVHQGLKYIDNNLGGTIPFDVIIKFPPYVAETNLDADFEDDFFDEDSTEQFPEKYWFTPDKVNLVRDLHDYIESLPRTGKVLSLASVERVAREFNDGKQLGALQLVGALGALPDDVRAELINPYASPADGEFRISIRVKEYGEPFSRDLMLREIRSYAQNKLNIEPENIRLTGMMVMFNNMLKELFTSQQSSILFVICSTFVMFLILLRSPLLALFGLLPNILAAGVILAFMGFAKIPLDLMTITIAALVIGIGVDDATHYLHRFRKEFSATGDVIESVQRCHASTGHALYFTSFTVIAGFSVLAFSNFVPTMSFGLLTSLAMIIALIANLALLPGLLVCFHPNGHSHES
ncbi:MAG: MMPL family transporter [Pseudomonadales bacterium]|nr:MMPL family transporter [Pseudomonadales bacterium]